MKQSLLTLQNTNVHPFKLNVLFMFCLFHHYSWEFCVWFRTGNNEVTKQPSGVRSAGEGGVSSSSTNQPPFSSK